MRFLSTVETSHASQANLPAWNAVERWKKRRASVNRVLSTSPFTVERALDFLEQVRCRSLGPSRSIGTVTLLGP
jgi:hypothetical protein